MDKNEHKKQKQQHLFSIFVLGLDITLESYFVLFPLHAYSYNINEYL
jgi:hypothetical protein